MCAPLRIADLQPETKKAAASFTLSADASSLGTIANVEFYGNGALLGTATAAPYSYVWNNVAAGYYTLSAKATDTLGQSTTSNFVNVISATPPVVSLTSPAANTVSPAPGSFTLTANAWGTSSGLKSVSFYSGATLLGTATNAPYTFTWNNVAAGSYGLTATATDNNNVTASSGAVAVTVAANQPPAVSLTSPAANASSNAPGSFTLSANATSTGSTIARVDFYQGATLIGTATAAPYSFNWTNIPVGSYNLTAKATDLLNVATTSSPVSVTVNTGVVQAYYIHADHLDTPRVITDTAGNTVWQWDNVDPFGNNMANENPNGQGAFSFNLRFPGQSFDRETNTHYNFHRDYDPSIGRYIQSDPIGLKGGINTYTYVNGNPLSYVDPTGLDITVSFDGGAAILAGHVGIGVNSPNTVGQRPQPGQNPLAIIAGQNVPGQISPDPAPDARVVIPTTPRQDQQAQQCIDTRTREQQNYNLYQNNCAQFAGQCLRAAGVPVPDTRYPRTLFNNLQHRFAGDQ